MAEKIEIQKPLMADVDRRSQAFGGTSGRYRAFGGRGYRLQAFGGRSFTVVHESLVANGFGDYKPLVADVVVYKAMVAFIDRRSRAFGGGRGRLQAFGGRGYRLEAYRGIRGSLLTNLWREICV